MDGEVTVVVEVPELQPADDIPVVEESTTAIIETAVELAGIIDDARQEGNKADEVIVISLEMVFAELKELRGMIEYLADEVATLTAIEVAEIVVDEPPQVVEEITEVAENILPPLEPVLEVNEPAPRVQERKRKFI